MRKLTPFDRIEEIFMDADPETFAQLEERIATIKRLRRLDRPRRKPAKSTASAPAGEARTIVSASVQPMPSVPLLDIYREEAEIADGQGGIKNV